MKRNEENGYYQKVLVLLVKAMEDDIRIRIVIELLYNGPLSFRALGRRLRVNYKKLNEALKKLTVLKIVKIHIFNVSSSRSYKFYSLNEEIEELLKKLLL
ncbi:MAG: hypothetical protein DRO13_04580 [Thermoprotei archaeon]|nr:MAG: hypothetical protein DRO13_04580 [Thermoprotei archaeon]